MNQDRISHLQRMLEQVGSTNDGGAKESLESMAQQSAARGETLDARRVNPAAIETEMALESLDVLRRGDMVDSEQQFALEAIVMPFFRPVVDVVENKFKDSHLTNKWAHLSSGNLRSRIEECFLSVGRINVPGMPSLPYAGTGFVVGDGLLMTNRHVAHIFARGLGTQSVGFRSGQTAKIDFYHENGQTTSDSLVVDDVLMIHPWWDMALLKVSGLPAQRKPLSISTQDPRQLADREVIVVGYPGYDPNGDEEFQRVQNRIFRSTYYVKRMQPGQLKVHEDIRDEMHREVVTAITHDCSTLGGNSGSVVLALPPKDRPDDPIEVIGLHFAGQYLVANYAVPTFDLAQDSRIVSEGLNITGRLDPRGDFYGPIWTKADATEASGDTTGASAGSHLQSPRAQLGTAADSLDSQTATWTIPLQVSVSIGNPNTVPVASVSDVSASITQPAAIPPASRPIPIEGLFSSSPPVTVVPMTEFSRESLLADTFGWQTSLSLALASQLSYDNANTVEGTVKDVWSFDDCHFVEEDDTQCFVATASDVVMVAFRGTASVGDWLTDLNALSTERFYGTVHRGFRNAFAVVDAKLREILNDVPDRPIVLTGHSLGGALAMIAAAEWAGQIPVSRIYTYGQPAVGKRRFPAFMIEHYAGKIFRFVNDDDIVTMVPPTYDHVGRLRQLGPSGSLQESTPVVGAEAMTTGGVSAENQGPTVGRTTMSELEFDRLRAELLEARMRRQQPGVESAPAIESPMLEGFFPSFNDHRIANYISKIMKNVTA